MSGHTGDIHKTARGLCHAMRTHLGQGLGFLYDLSVGSDLMDKPIWAKRFFFVLLCIVCTFQ